LTSLPDPSGNSSPLGGEQKHCILLLIPATSYRATDFLNAARQLGVEVIVGSNHQPVLEKFSNGRTLRLGFEPTNQNVALIRAHVRRFPVSVIVGTDEESVTLAALASMVLGLPHNSVQSVKAAHNKYLFRAALVNAGLRSPDFRLISLQDDLPNIAQSVAYPCVLKPLTLSASRGVIRADDESAFLAACARITKILDSVSQDTELLQVTSILVEDYIPGQEVSLEGILKDGALRVLAIFDKPNPLVGPFFEETIYVTPSRHSEALQKQIVDATAQAAQALGLTNGPVHGEIRFNDEGAWVVELAARSIGGLCSHTLKFTDGARLEDLILRAALDLPTENFRCEDQASGVMMIPIPKAGRLDAVTGLKAARAVDGIDEITISAHIGEWLLPVPEGDRYLGFIFARAGEPAEVERALRKAHDHLNFTIVRANH
jgi:biotin carboxylase